MVYLEPGRGFSILAAGIALTRIKFTKIAC
jgi:hypothetical protein